METKVNGTERCGDDPCSLCAGAQAAAAPSVAPDPDHYTIRELAQEFQVSVRALRFYEDRKLLRPRRIGGARLYDARDRLRLQMILRGKRLGFTLSEIHEILARGGFACDTGGTGLGLTGEEAALQLSHLERQRREIDQAIAELRIAAGRPDDGAPHPESAAPPALFASSDASPLAPADRKCPETKRMEISMQSHLNAESLDAESMMQS
ncbi:MAG TPA: MerR family transcriptional regulator [Methylocella sp.]|nr:MerR family transcriptional regulator [Methylocella sp.]